MIRIQIYCDSCTSSIDTFVEAGKMQAVTSAFDEHWHNAECLNQKEEPRGQQVQAVPGGEEARRHQPGQEPTGGSEQGEPAPGAGGQRIGRA